MTDQWGVGSKTDEPAFRTVRVGKTPVGLIMGEFPHSRSDNNIYARWPTGTIHEFAGHYICVRVELETYNYLKESELSGDEVRKGGTGRIWFDDEQVYEFFFRNMEDACHRAASLIGKLQEHPLSPFDNVEGRKVYYRNTPAVITRYIGEQGCVVVATEDGSPFPEPAYREEDGWDTERQSEIKDDILSPHFWWWRK